MPDYSKAKIYKIVCNITGDVYIGSTCQSLAKRLGDHVSTYKRHVRFDIRSENSYKIIKNGSFNIILIEEYPCENKYQLEQRERFFIDKIECINKVIPTRSQEEYRKENSEKNKKYKKEYYNINKEIFREKAKKYREENRDIIRIKQNEKIPCVCGLLISKTNLKRHMETPKHLRLMGQI